MISEYWTKKQNIQLQDDCKKYNISLMVKKEIERVIENLDSNYGMERSKKDYGGCVYLLVANEEKEHSKILEKYFLDEEDYEFKDILIENEEEIWISETYITSTEYSIIIIYKINKWKCLIDI